MNPMKATSKLTTFVFLAFICVSGFGRIVGENISPSRDQGFCGIKGNGILGDGKGNGVYFNGQGNGFCGNENGNGFCDNDLFGTKDNGFESQAC